MARTVEYSVLRVTPDPRKGEVLNIGIVVFGAERTDLRILPSLAKLRALDPNIDTDRLYALAERLPAMLDRAPTVDARWRMLNGLGVVTATERGAFTLLAEDGYEPQIAQIMTDLVQPPSRQSRRLDKAGRLRTDLRRFFKERKLLGAQLDDIDKHLVVPSFPIAPNEDLYVDFALKNGRYRLTETIDFRVTPAAIRTKKLSEAALSSVTLDQARTMLDNNVCRYIVYAASSEVEPLVQSHLNLLSQYTDRLFNFLSGEDMRSYSHMIAEAVGPSRVFDVADGLEGPGKQSAV